MDPREPLRRPDPDADALDAADAPPESQQHDRRITTPATPPSTPASSFIEDYSTPLMLHELTRVKLERAASGQMSGRRGAPSLRQIVLLSNVFGAASQPSPEPEQDAREQHESAELDRRRKAEEERWLDQLLEEMLEVEEDDDTEDSYVQVSFRDDRSAMEDSGFLEQSSSDPSLRSNPLAAIDEEELADPPPRTSPTRPEEALLGSEDDNHLGQPYLSTSPPTSPPLPCRSPPIAVPERPTRGVRSYATEEVDFHFSSPPDLPPPLIPDESPPGLGSSMSVLGTSADSTESDFEEERDRWLATRRPGILSLATTPTTKGTTIGPVEIVFPPAHASFDLPPELPYYRDSLATLPSTDPNSAALVRRSIFIPPVPTPTPAWSPRPPRSLSVPPATRSRNAPPPPSADPRPIFQGGVVKSYYDFVDFGGSTKPQLPASCSAPSASRGRDDLALVLASAPLPQFGAAGGGLHGVGWRSRSLSPEGRGRREWARLSDVAMDHPLDD